MKTILIENKYLLNNNCAKRWTVSVIFPYNANNILNNIKSDFTTRAGHWYGLPKFQ